MYWHISWFVCVVLELLTNGMFVVRFFFLRLFIDCSLLWISQGVLPLLLRHLDMSADQVTVLTPNDREKEAFEARDEFGVHVVIDR